MLSAYAAVDFINALLKPIDPNFRCDWSYVGWAHRFNLALLGRWIGFSIPDLEMDQANAQQLLLCRLTDALYHHGFADIAARLARGEVLQPEPEFSDFEQLRHHRQLWRFTRANDNSLFAVFGDRNQRIRLPLNDFSFDRAYRTWRITFSTSSPQIGLDSNGKVWVGSDFGRITLSGLMFSFYQESSSDSPVLTRVEIQPKVADIQQSIEQIDVSTMSSADPFLINKTTTSFEVISTPPRIESPNWNYNRLIPRPFLDDEQIQRLMPFWDLSSEAGQPENSGSIPQQCFNCRNLYGKSHGGNLLICGFHPYGHEGECPDFEAQ